MNAWQWAALVDILFSVLKEVLAVFVIGGNQ
jgi:hypothetical protein